MAESRYRVVFQLDRQPSTEFIFSFDLDAALQQREEDAYRLQMKSTDLSLSNYVIAPMLAKTKWPLGSWWVATYITLRETDEVTQPMMILLEEEANGIWKSYRLTAERLPALSDPVGYTE